MRGVTAASNGEKRRKLTRKSKNINERKELKIREDRSRKKVYRQLKIEYKKSQIAETKIQ